MYFHFMIVNLSTWSIIKGVSRPLANKWYKNGELPGAYKAQPDVKNGTIFAVPRRSIPFRIYGII